MKFYTFGDYFFPVVFTVFFIAILAAPQKGTNKPTPIKIYDPTETEQVIERQRLARIEQDCMTEALWHEGRGESQIGQLAIAEVIFNRIDNKDFPDTVCDVVHEKVTRDYEHYTTNRCQFSYYCDNISDEIVVTEDNAYLVAFVNQNVKLAYKLRASEEIDITMGAIYYSTDIPGLQIGDHKFRDTY